MSSLGRWSVVSNEDLYIGPTLLAPGPKEPSDTGDTIAKAIFIPLILAFAFVILVFYVLFSTAEVEGPSMMPTLRNGDHVLITHGDKNLKRGDVVVVRVNEEGVESELVKRVVGVPGDTVEVRGDVAIVNGVPEPQLGQLVKPDYAVSRQPAKVPDGYIYVMGDNRAVSEDSRYIGPVGLAGIRGKVVAVFAPITRLHLVH
jgi:signal peptidase I